MPDDPIDSLWDKASAEKRADPIDDLWGKAVGASTAEMPRPAPQPAQEVYADGSPVNTARSFDAAIGTERTAPDVPDEATRTEAFREAVDAPRRAFEADQIAKRQAENDTYYNRSIVRPLKAGAAGFAAGVDRLYETADAATRWAGGLAENVLTGKDISEEQKRGIARDTVRHGPSDLVGGQQAVENMKREDPGATGMIEGAQKFGSFAADLGVMIGTGKALPGLEGWAVGSMASDAATEAPDPFRAAANGAIAYGGAKLGTMVAAPLVARILKASAEKMLPSQAALVAKVLTGVGEGTGMVAAPHITQDGLHSALLGAIQGNPDDQVAVAQNVVLMAVFRTFHKEIPTEVAAAYMRGDLARVPKQLRPLMDTLAGPVFRGGSDVAREGVETNPARRTRVLADQAAAREAARGAPRTSPLNPEGIGINPTGRPIRASEPMQVEPPIEQARPIGYESPVAADPFRVDPDPYRTGEPEAPSRFTPPEAKVAPPKAPPAEAPVEAPSPVRAAPVAPIRKDEAPVEPPASARPEAPKVEAPARHPETEEVVRKANEHLRKIEEEWGGSEPPKPPERPAEPSNPDDLTSVKNRMVNRERVKRGLGELREPLTRGQEEVVNRAIDRLADNPDAGRMLVEELNTKHRPLSDEDVAVLTIHRKNLRDAVKAADRAGIEAAKANNGEGDHGKIEAAKKLADEANNALLQSEFAAHGGGTETARGLAMRRIEMKNDYSLEKMRFDRLRENGYKELSRDRQAVQDKQTEELHKRIKTALEERDAAVTRADALEAERKFRETLGDVRSRKAPGAKALDGSKNKIVTKEVADAALARILERARNPQSNIGFDPTVIKDYIIRGAYHVERGVRGLAEWTASMVSEFGDEVRPHLEEIWPAAQAQLRDATIGEAKAKIGERTKAGKGIEREVGKLAEMFVEQGITDPTKLAEAVHEVVRGANDAITLREVKDAISGYGDQRKLDMDPNKVILRDIKARLQKMSALEDMANRKKPEASGVQRQEPSDAARELTKQINEGKKKAIAEGWWKEETGPGQLRSALDAAKRRAENDLKDMDRQIAARKKDVPNRTALKPDAELTELLAKKAAKKAEFDAMFGKAGLSDAQRAEMAAKSAERSAAEWERKITTGEIEPTTGGKKQGPLTEAQQRAKDLREYVAELRDLARPHRTPEEIAQKSLMTYLRNREAMFQKRVDTGQLEPKPRVARPRNAEAIEAEAKVDTAKRAWQEALFRDRIAKKHWVQKAAMIPVQSLHTARSIMTSLDLSAVFRQGGITALSHPIRAARALPDMFKAGWSKAGQAKAEAEIRMHDDYALAKKAGVFFSEHGDVSMSKMEENYMSRWAEKIPLVAGSQRAYTTFLNRIRMDSFSAMSRSLSQNGAPTMKEAAALAEYVNVATGRGGGGDSQILTGLNTVFFAPRLVASRFQFLVGQPMVGGSMRTRGLIAKEYARFLIGAATVVGLGKLMAGDDKLDPIDSEGLKINLGDTHLDTLAGLAQVTTFLRRETQSAWQSRPGGPGAERDAMKDAVQFMRSKFAPLVGAYIDATTGTNVVGDKVTWPGALTGLVTPMGFRGKDDDGDPAFVTGGDIHKAWVEHGGPAALGLLVLQTFGMAVQNYDRDRKKKKKKPHEPYTGN